MKYIILSGIVVGYLLAEIDPQGAEWVSFSFGLAIPAFLLATFLNADFGQK